MNSDYYNQLLDEYLLGRLGEAGRLQVEERAARDPAFAAEMELRRIIIEGIELAGRDALREKIAGIDASLAGQGFFESSEPAWKVSRSPWFGRRRLLWAASLALLLSAGFWLLLDKRAQRKNEIIVSPSTKNAIDSTRQYNAPQMPETPPAIPDDHSLSSDRRYAALARAAYIAPDFSNLRSPDDGTSPLEQASEAFANSDFPNALHLLDTIPAGVPGYWQAAEIRAHSLFRLNKIKQSAQLFRQIAESGQLPFSERAEWFLLICYGMDFPGQKNAFKSLSAKILADQGHPYYEQAKSLTAKISE